MRRLSAALVSVLLVAACGGGGGGPDSSVDQTGGGDTTPTTPAPTPTSEIDSPCDLADPGMVEQVFAGSASDGIEGAAKNCNFTIDGGLVDSVDVFYFGTDDGWDVIRDGYDANRGGTTDVEGIGDEAFYPGDFGATELVVRAEGHVFAVSVFILDGGDKDVEEMAVAQLAGLIANSLG